jgi:hypothetical protein
VKSAKLRSREKCPLHGSYFCCGRSRPERSTFKSGVGKVNAKWQYMGRGVWRIPDEHHERGYREKRSAESMRQLLKEKIVEQSGCCGLCGQKFDDYRDTVLDHKEPKGMGGAWTDDHRDNLHAVHHLPCNFEKGSKRIA